MGGMGLGGVHSHFCVQANCSVEVVLWLCCVVVGVVTISRNWFSTHILDEEGPSHIGFLFLNKKTKTQLNQ